MNRGFAAIGEPGVAVCLLPGTEVVMDRVPEYDHLLGRFFPKLRSRKTGGSKVARFRQVKPNEVGVHHDAIEFPNGKTVLIAELLLGQEVTVLQLPVQTSKDRAEPSRQLPEAAEITA